jgi:hypothetical protein
MNPFWNMSRYFPTIYNKIIQIVKIFLAGIMLSYAV